MIQAKEHQAAEEDASEPQRDVAYRKLWRLLMLDQLPYGERLREPEWAKRLNVNRMALREAFARLEAEGVIERGPRTGYFVPDMDDEQIEEIRQVRGALELCAAELILKNKPDLSPLHRVCDEHQSLIDMDYPLGAAEADRRFHEILVELSGNKRLATIYRRSPLPILVRNHITRKDWQKINIQSLVQHRQIIEALESGNLRQTRKKFQEHFGKII